MTIFTGKYPAYRSPITRSVPADPKSKQALAPGRDEMGGSADNRAAIRASGGRGLHAGLWAGFYEPWPCWSSQPGSAGTWSADRRRPRFKIALRCFRIQRTAPTGISRTALVRATFRQCGRSRNRRRKVNG